jgi:hypothetical protein
VKAHTHTLRGNDVQLTPVTMDSVKYCTATGMKVLLPALLIIAGMEIFGNESEGSPDSTHSTSK